MLKTKSIILQMEQDQDQYRRKYINERGNCVFPMFIGSQERYRFDFALLPQGWKQYDTYQDAWYFGVWVHTEKRLVLTFAEGDLTLVTCPTIDGLRAELASMAEFYGDPPPAFVSIGADGITNHYDERPSV